MTSAVGAADLLAEMVARAMKSIINTRFRLKVFILNCFILFLFLFHPSFFLNKNLFSPLISNLFAFIYKKKNDLIWIPLFLSILVWFKTKQKMQRDTVGEVKGPVIEPFRQALTEFLNLSFGIIVNLSFYSYTNT